MNKQEIQNERTRQLAAEGRRASQVRRERRAHAEAQRAKQLERQRTTKETT